MARAWVLGDTAVLISRQLLETPVSGDPRRPLLFHVPWFGFLVPLKLCARYSFLTQTKDTFFACVLFYSFLFYIGVQLINDVVFVLGVEQSHLVIHIHVILNT